MTIDEAIEAIETIVRYPRTPIGCSTKDALKLGIEALTVIREQGLEYYIIPSELLPGETPPKRCGLRYRVNVKQTAKHEEYWDCTVDDVGYEMAEILEKSDALVAELEKRYPIKVLDEKQS